jgi:hypothetical protein
MKGLGLNLILRHYLCNSSETANHKSKIYTHPGKTTVGTYVDYMFHFLLTPPLHHIRVARLCIFKPKIQIWQWKMFIYFMSIWNILWQFGRFYGNSVHFQIIWHIFPHFGKLKQENLAALHHKSTLVTR